MTDWLVGIGYALFLLGMFVVWLGVPAFFGE